MIGIECCEWDIWSYCYPHKGASSWMRSNKARYLHLAFKREKPEQFMHIYRRNWWRVRITPTAPIEDSAPNLCSLISSPSVVVSLIGRDGLTPKDIEEDTFNAMCIIETPLKVSARLTWPVEGAANLTKCCQSNITRSLSFKLGYPLILASPASRWTKTPVVPNRKNTTDVFISPMIVYKLPQSHLPECVSWVKNASHLG